MKFTQKDFEVVEPLRKYRFPRMPFEPAADAEVFHPYKPSVPCPARRKSISFNFPTRSIGRDCTGR
jgi:hypothetical protein